MKQYINLLNKVLHEGESRQDRTGTGTLSLFAEKMVFDLSAGFPMVTVRKVDFQSTVDELLWFISGSTNLNDLPKRTQRWWVHWADSNGELGPIYGEQLRNQRTVSGSGSIVVCDQLLSIIKSLKENPLSRRHIINLWNTASMELANLPCCHGSIIQFFVSYREDGPYLDCQMYQRSADLVVGVPVNIASYSLLTHMIAQQVNMKPGVFTWVGGDVHIYKNLIDVAIEISTRIPFGHPMLTLEKAKDITSYNEVEIELLNYKHWPSIDMKISI